jgi:hypothetical protein
VVSARFQRLPGWLERVPGWPDGPWRPAQGAGGVLLVGAAVLAGVASTAAPRLTLGVVCIAAITVALFGMATASLTGDRGFLLKIFLLAILVRVTVATVTYHLLPYGFFAPDEIGYTGLGSNLAASGLPNPIEVVRSARGWYYFNAILIQFFGQDSQLLARLWNCGVGALVPVLCYRLTASFGGPAAARVAAVLTALFPSLVLWSSLNLKDTDTHVLILAIMILSLRMQRGWRLRYLLLMAPILLALASLRQYLLIPLLAAVLVAQMVVRRDVFANLFVVVIVAALLVVPLTLTLPDLSEWSPRVTNVKDVNTLRAGFASGAASAYLNDSSFSSSAEVILFLPLGLMYFFLGPFPWSPGGLLQQIATPEMFLYYALLPFVLFGLRKGLKSHLGRVLPLITFGGIVAVSYSLALTNFGTLFRFRDQLLLLLLCFAGWGLASTRDVLSRRKKIGPAAQPSPPSFAVNEPSKLR